MPFDGHASEGGEEKREEQGGDGKDNVRFKGLLSKADRRSIPRCNRTRPLSETTDVAREGSRPLLLIWFIKGLRRAAKGRGRHQAHRLVLVHAQKAPTNSRQVPAFRRAEARNADEERVLLRGLVAGDSVRTQGLSLRAATG